MIVRQVARVLSALFLCTTLLSPSASAQENVAPPQAPPQRPTRVYLVALREFTSPSLDSLATHYRNRYGITVEVLPQREIYGAQLNIWRQKVVAEELIGLMRSSYPEIADNPEAAMIGLISSFEMYAYGSSAPSVLDWRQDGRFAVISTAALDSGNFMHPVSPDLMRARAQKMVTRNLGLTYFGLTLNGDPSSVLFANLGSREDLDRMGPELPV